MTTLMSINGEVKIESEDFPRKFRVTSRFNGNTYGCDETLTPHKRGPGFTLVLGNGCGKCHSSGFLPHYIGIFDGVCMACNGTGMLGTRKVAVYPVEIAEKRAAAKAEKAAAKIAAERAEAEAANARWADAIAWGKTQREDSFEYSVAHKADHGPLTEKQGEALAAAMERKQRWAEERAAAEAAKANEHLGAEGERVEFDGTVVFTKSLGWGEFGERWIVKFEDERGNVAVWFTGDRGADFERGDRAKVRGTVKSLDEYQGRKSTVLTRCRVAAVESAA